MTRHQGRLLQQLTDRLEYHLNQVCDARACETPEHEETRELIALARQALKTSITGVTIHLNEPRSVAPLPHPDDYRRRA
jgi:hypothetical protein